MTTAHATENLVPNVQELSVEESAELFDAAARRHLGMSGSEFLVSWDQGRFAGEPECVEAMSVAMLIPLVR
ncbi:MAG: hypothetical protein DLM55_08445 [Acidimicrobiales bacterium]|nr:MAG: hypothetical protein DLM55_08445 [Acidimicrobiales bacterium]